MIYNIIKLQKRTKTILTLIMRKGFTEKGTFDLHVSLFLKGYKFHTVRVILINVQFNHPIISSCSFIIKLAAYSQPWSVSCCYSLTLTEYHNNESCIITHFLLWFLLYSVKHLTLTHVVEWYSNSFLFPSNITFYVCITIWNWRALC